LRAPEALRSIGSRLHDSTVIGVRQSLLKGSSTIRHFVCRVLALPSRWPLHTLMQLRDSERGAAIVEVAIVLPLVLFIAMAIIDFSTIVLRTNAITSATNDVARTLAIQAGSAQYANADADALARFVRRTAQVSDDIELVVVYDASGPGELPPLRCMEANPQAADRCNVFDKQDLKKVKTNQGNGNTQCVGNSRRWCSTERSEGDLLGVWVRGRAEGYAGVIPGRTVENFVVIPVDAP
jgi:Flp pilus assembly pilin Flp